MKSFTFGALIIPTTSDSEIGAELNSFRTRICACKTYKNGPSANSKIILFFFPFI